jgi:ADP-ribose pyrophosphatase
MRILDLQKLTDEKWLNLFAATFEHKGHTGRWLFASRKAQPQKEGPGAGDAVVIVPVLRNPGEPPRLVMIKEFRAPIGSVVWALPAGLLEKGEPVEETVRREMMEETGMEVVRFKRLTQPLYSSAGMTDEAAALAFVDVRSTPESLPKLEASEDIEVVLLDFDGVCRLCDDAGAKIDAKAWSALYLYQQLGEFL